jgi:hypothetical protein
VEGIDLEFEERLIPEAIGLPLHGSDFVVGALQGGGGDRAGVMGQSLARDGCYLLHAYVPLKDGTPMYLGQSIPVLAQPSHFTPHFRIFESRTPKVFTTTRQGWALADANCAA